MSKPEFNDSTLILAGHGSTQNDGSAAAVTLQAGELRRRGLFAEVREGFWKQVPLLAEVIAAVKTPRVFIVPFFTGEGYFAEQAIPQALGFRTDACASWDRVQQREGRWIHYARPVGTHDSITRVILARAREVVARHPFPRAPREAEVSLFIAGHGTPRDNNSRRSVEAHADRIRSMGLYASVTAVFMEEEPRIGDSPKLATTRNVVVVPFFISDGLHVEEDIPILLGEPAGRVRERLAAGQPTWRNPTGRGDRHVWFARAVGTDPGMAEVILERVREARLFPCSRETPLPDPLLVELGDGENRRHPTQ